MPTFRLSRSWLPYAFIGVAAGLLSGFFGVGGGTIIVPALIFFCGYGQRLAAGTSLAAIVLPSLVGMIGYIPNGSVDWIAGGLIAAGSIVGAQLGSWLLHKLPVAFLRWLFVGFLVIVGVNMFLSVPDRGASLVIDVPIAVGLITLGFVTGVLAGLIGVGGGIIVVPALMLLFGVSDWVAKGTSLLMILPTSISGTIGNVRHRNVDLEGALVIGIVAAAFSFIGVQLALMTPAQVASILFGLYILFLIVRMSWNAIRPKDKDS